jgi:hypothetical protein
MAKKPCFTLKQHRKAGQQLQLMQNKLSTLSSEISKAYPLSTKVLLLTNRAEDAIRKLRDLLLNLSYQESPGHKHNLYLLGGGYGQPKKRPREE